MPKQTGIEEENIKEDSIIQVLEDYDRLLWKQIHSAKENLPSWVEPEDLYQDGVEDILRQSRRFSTGKNSSRKTWVYFSVQNARANFFRKYLRRVKNPPRFIRIHEHYLPEQESFEDTLIERLEKERAIKEIWSSLNDIEREILSERLKNLTPLEISEKLGKTESLIHTRLHLIRKKLRSFLI